MLPEIFVKLTAPRPNVACTRPFDQKTALGGNDNCCSSFQLLRSLSLSPIVLCLVSLIISRDYINSYVRNLCLGNYLTASNQFSFGCFIPLHIPSNAAAVSMLWMQRHTNRGAHGIRVIQPLFVCNALIHRTKILESDKKTLCVIYMQMNNYWSIGAITHKIYRFHFLPYSMNWCRSVNSIGPAVKREAFDIFHLCIFDHTVVASVFSFFFFFFLISLSSSIIL